MSRKLAAAAALTFMLLGAATASAAEHKVVFQIDDADPGRMTLLLNNVQNIEEYYAKKGDTAQVHVVAYGPGLKMLLKDSPVAERISAMSLQFDGLEFDACHNTLMGMEKKAGHKLTLVDEATVVPAGVAKIVELEEDGYSYVKP
ncbi:DsrE family protein [Acidimangrovimonas sediminis]|uniref:DsrE family protein n=1 Tax=Acidimangrovimonas sediminis TaxID=2056283 RepID=UPI000C807D12|nr:DsrE family protein [Acidimangrovimonas sediminis]